MQTTIKLIFSYVHIRRFTLQSNHAYIQFLCDNNTIISINGLYRHLNAPRSDSSPRHAKNDKINIQLRTRFSLRDLYACDNNIHLIQFLSRAYIDILRALDIIINNMHTLITNVTQDYLYVVRMSGHHE